MLMLMLSGDALLQYDYHHSYAAMLLQQYSMHSTFW
jgi:hypothetical protein